MTKDFNNKNYCVAFLDDESEFLDIIKGWQKDVPIKAKTTENHSELLTWVEEGQVDAVVSDLQMESMDGVEVLTRVHDIAPHLKKILLTGFLPASSEYEACERMGAIIHYKSDIGRLFENLTPELKQEEFKIQNAYAKTSIKKLLDSNLLNYLTEDLIADLEAIQDQNQKIVISSSTSISVKELIDEIKKRTVLGDEYIRLWNDTKKTLKKLGKK